MVSFGYNLDPFGRCSVSGRQQQVNVKIQRLVGERLLALVRGFSSINRRSDKNGKHHKKGKPEMIELTQLTEASPRTRVNGKAARK